MVTEWLHLALNCFNKIIVMMKIESESDSKPKLLSEMMKNNTYSQPNKAWHSWNVALDILFAYLEIST
jgi:hypothetical protein